MKLLRGVVLAGWMAAVAAVAAVPAVPAGASAQDDSSGYVGMRAFRGQPYSLAIKSTRTRLLADGTTVTRVSDERHMRDSAGRMRSELSSERGGIANVEMISIFDPGARAMIDLFPSRKEARIRHFPAPHEPTQEELAERAKRQAEAQAARAARGDQPAAAHHESPRPEVLGQRDIQGVLAEGRRIVRVTPAGQDGNDRELRTVTEVWYSPDLRIDLDSTTDDPMTGKTERVVTELDRSEPDPNLFKVPEGYKVIEEPRTE